MRNNRLANVFSLCHNCGQPCYAQNYYCEDCANELFEAECGINEQLNDKITDLEAKLAESEKSRLMWQEMYKSADRQNKSICETDIYPLQEENQQLKQQLAESEKNFIVANNLRKKSDEVLLNYKTEKYGLDKTIQELREMKLSLPEKEWYYKGFENCERQMSSHIADLTLEVKELKQKLAEKDAEIKRRVAVYEQQFIEQTNENAKIQEQLIQKNNQDKIELLEKVKEIVNSVYREPSLTRFGIINSIDTLIKKIKGE